MNFNGYESSTINVKRIRLPWDQIMEVLFFAWAFVYCLLLWAS